jgi:hypothetical protein
MLQKQRGDFVKIDHSSHSSPPYRRTEGIRHAVGREGIPTAERIHIRSAGRLVSEAYSRLEISASKSERLLCAFKILAQQVVKRMRGTVPVQHFPWPIVEDRLDPFDFRP